MANRRQTIHDFYKPKPHNMAQLLEKAAASSDRYSFQGNAIKWAVIIRTDLNGYSEWARDRKVEERAQLLNDYFSQVVPTLEEYGGVFFRDEGDCIVSIFTDYFSTGASYEKAERFCLIVTANEYGLPKLTAKSAIACGNIAIFQKAHEVGSQDWSAEGEPFVRSARLEQAMSSKKQIVYFKQDYDNFFYQTNVGSNGFPSAWRVEQEKLQVPGLSLSGGWTDVVVLHHK